MATPVFFYTIDAVDANGFTSVQVTPAVQADFVQGTHTATLSWVAPAGTIAGYNVFRGVALAGPFTQINTNLVTATSFQDTFAVPGAPTGLTVTVS